MYSSAMNVTPHPFLLPGAPTDSTFGEEQADQSYQQHRDQVSREGEVILKVVRGICCELNALRQDEIVSLAQT